MKNAFCVLTAAVVGVCGMSLHAYANAFTAGDLVVTQIGATGSSTTLTSMGTASFLQEFAPDGSSVQTLALPTAANGANNPLTISGTAGSEGQLSLSADGQYLAIAGYDIGVGGTTQGASTLGLVNAGGFIDTSTTTTALSGNNTRGAASLDGTQIWATGPSGLVYATVGSSGTSVISAPNLRNLSVVPASVSPTGAAQLFASSNKKILGVVAFSPALPTAATPTDALLSGMTTAPNTFAFFFANSTTMFVADATDGIQEWVESGGTWSNPITLAGSYVGLTGVQVGDTVSLYATTGTSGGWSVNNSLVADTFTFTSGDTGTGTFASPTTLATATGNSGFSGVAFAPVATPEPASLALLGLGGLILLRRKRA